MCAPHAGSMIRGCASPGVTDAVCHTPRQEDHATALAGPRTPPGPPWPGPPPDRRPCDTAPRRRWARRAARGAARPVPRSRVAREVPGVMPGCPPRPRPRVAGTEPRATLDRGSPAWAPGDTLPRGHPRHRLQTSPGVARAPAGVSDWACGTPGGGHTPPRPAHPQACGPGTGSA